MKFPFGSSGWFMDAAAQRSEAELQAQRAFVPPEPEENLGGEEQQSLLDNPDVVGDENLFMVFDQELSMQIVNEWSNGELGKFLREHL